MKRLGRAILFLTPLAALLLAASCRWGGPLEDCWDGLRVGSVVRVRLIEPYVEGGRFAWVEHADLTVPSCSARDALAPGEFTFTVDRRVAEGTGILCGEYVALPSPDVGVTFTSEEARFSAEGGVFSSVGPIDCGQWQFIVRRSSSHDRNPFGELAVEGAEPPVFVERAVASVCAGVPTCGDYWVAEVELVEP